MSGLKENFGGGGSGGAPTEELRGPDPAVHVATPNPGTPKMGGSF